MPLKKYVFLCKFALKYRSMTIGILYICTGKYGVFWKDFYLTGEKYLFPNLPKKYFVFSDMSEIYGAESHSNIVSIPVEHREWPYNTLLRFEMFDQHKALFESCDYLLFYNANSFFTAEIRPEEILPAAEEDYLAALCWKDVICMKTDDYTYDRNPHSTAYIPFGQGKEYYRGGFIGGRTPEFLQLIKTCRDWTDIDLKNKIMPLWHDESILNKYLLDKPVKMLTSAYGKAEEWRNPKHAKMIFRDKEKIFDVDTFKKTKYTRISVRRFIRKMKRSVKRLFQKTGNPCSSH